MGYMLVGTGALLAGCGMGSRGERMKQKGSILLNNVSSAPPGLADAVNFPLIEALHGRRARRFSLGASIPDGPLAFTSQHEPMPLDDIEQMMVLTAVAGNTGWFYLHPHNKHYIPNIPNYAVGASGRTFPSSAGFHTSEIGACMFDDVFGEKIPGMEQFADLVDVNNPYPLTYMEQLCLAEVTAELSTACYAGALMLQATGLGGWMFDGVTPFSVLGASGDAAMPGLGFRFDTDARWSIPNVTGLPGVFEGFCPPHYKDMRAATEAIVQRKFGPGGPFNAQTPGPYQENARVRGAGKVHDEEFKACVATMAQYVFDRFGKFPGTVPSIFVLTYLQAHHLDLEFYDRHFAPGAYLETHARHMERWHGQGKQA